MDHTNSTAQARLPGHAHFPYRGDFRSIGHRPQRKLASLDLGELLRSLTKVGPALFGRAQLFRQPQFGFGRVLVPSGFFSSRLPTGSRSSPAGLTPADAGFGIFQGGLIGRGIRTAAYPPRSR